MSLKYHNKSLELVGSQPNFGGDTFPGLPASIAEWYSLVNGLELLKKYSNEDVPVPPSEFEIIWHKEKELLVFMYENQGVFWWAFEDCDNEDPPVYVNEDPPSDHWVLCCNKFSDFIFTRLFDFYHWHDDNLLTLAVGKPIEKDMLDLLNLEYTSHPITHGGHSHTQYRFSDHDQKILIHDQSSSSGWYLSADTLSGLQNLLLSIEKRMSRFSLKLAVKTAIFGTYIFQRSVGKFEGTFEGHFPKINGG